MSKDDDADLRALVSSWIVASDEVINGVVSAILRTYEILFDARAEMP